MPSSSISTRRLRVGSRPRTEMFGRSPAPSSSRTYTPGTRRSISLALSGCVRCISRSPITVVAPGMRSIAPRAEPTTRASPTSSSCAAGAAALRAAQGLRRGLRPAGAGAAGSAVERGLRRRDGLSRAGGRGCVSAGAVGGGSGDVCATHSNEATRQEAPRIAALTLALEMMLRIICRIEGLLRAWPRTVNDEPCGHATTAMALR